MIRFPIYLDNNATTPMDPRVLEAMLPYFSDRFGNASSRQHAFGWIAEDGVTHARAQLAHLIGAEAQEVVFTSGATESINLAIKGIVENYASKGNQIVILASEHAAVLDTCRELAKKGTDVIVLPVLPSGIVDLNVLEKNITERTLLVCVMIANNETGVLQPVREIAALTHKMGAIFMTDASQAVGKVSVNVKTEGIDVMPFSAHKMYGPKGCGALYVRRKEPRVSLKAQLNGGGHERGLRSGTLNVPGIVGFGKAAEICEQEMVDEGERLSGLRNRLESALQDRGLAAINGDALHRLPHVSNLLLTNKQGERLMMENPNIAFSTGAACASAQDHPSHVLAAMRLSEQEIKHSVRFGLGRFTTTEEIDWVLKNLIFV